MLIYMISVNKMSDMLHSIKKQQYMHTYITLAVKIFRYIVFHVTEKIKLKFDNILVLTVFSWTRHARFLWNTWEN